VDGSGTVAKSISARWARVAPFLEIHRAAGAVLREVEGGEYPVRYEHPFEEHRAAQRKAGLFDVSFLGKLEVAGKDARELLHRVASADLKARSPGEGTWSFLLDGRGKILHAFEALATPDGFLCLTESGDAAKLAESIEKLRFSEELGMRDFSALGALLVAGPLSERIVSAASGGVSLPGGEHRHGFVTIAGERVLAVRDRRTGLDGLLLLMPASGAAAVLASIEAAGLPMGLRRCGLAAFDSLRIEAGLPRFGLDYTNDLFPQEVGILEAYSLEKGCYPGQETVARIDTYGKTHRRLTGLVLDSPNEDLPERGDKLRRDGEEVGEVRSWAISPTLEKPIALGVVRNVKAPAGTTLEVHEGSRQFTAKVVDPPIVR
jgi:glycine cleavage system T protein (aminomethyltransferase)